MNQTAFNFDLAERAKQRGLLLTSVKNAEFLHVARALARTLAKNQPISADDVRKLTEQRGIVPESPNAWGALFTTKEWVWAKDYHDPDNGIEHGMIQSRYVTNHRRWIKLWRLR